LRELKKHIKRLNEIPELFGEKEVLCVDDKESNQYKLPGILGPGMGYMRVASMKMYCLRETE